MHGYVEPPECGHQPSCGKAPSPPKTAPETGGRRPAGYPCRWRGICRAGNQNQRNSHSQHLQTSKSLPPTAPRPGGTESLQHTSHGQRCAAPRLPSLAKRIRHDGVSAAAAGVTLNHRTAPPLANITMKFSLPRVMNSLRAGTRPISCAIRPPMVSKLSSSSESLGCMSTLKCSLMRSIGVSPLTRKLPSARL